MIEKCEDYLNTLCREIPQRPVGSSGNREATDYFQKVVKGYGWNVVSTPFQAMD